MVSGVDTPGAGLALLLLASSVVNYVMSERATALFNTRREMAREMAAVDQLVHDQLSQRSHH